MHQLKVNEIYLIYIHTYIRSRRIIVSSIFHVNVYVSLFPSLFVTALGAAETTGGAKEREGEARSVEEEGQTRSQRDRFDGGEATTSGIFEWGVEDPVLRISNNPIRVCR